MAKHVRKHEEISIITPVFSPAVRKWIYAISTAVIPLLVAYGMIQDVHAPLWLALAGQVLATGTAWAHTPQESEKYERP